MGSGGLVADSLWQSDACSLEDGSDLAFDGSADGDRLAILFDGGLLEAVEIPQQRLPFGGQAFGPAEPAQFLAEDEREERTKGMIATLHLQI